MRILTPFWPPRPTPTCLSQRVASLLSSQHGCYTGFHFLVHWQNCYLWVASGGKDFYPLNPGILTYDLSRLPPVFIGTELFMFGRICVVPQIRGMPGWILRWLWWWWRSRGVHAGLGRVCVAGAERQGGALLSLCSFGLKEGSRGSGE